MNNNENNNQNQNNYVTPKKVDFSKVTLTEHQDNFLNRERDNIVNATIQANSSLDQAKASVANNTIKVKKKNPILRVLVVVILLIGAVLITYLAVHASYKFIESGKETTTTTTTLKVNQLSKYLNNTSIARKFQNGNDYILLSPVIDGIPKYYLFITTSTSGIEYQELGEYEIDGNILRMHGYEGEERVLSVGDKAMETDGTMFNMYDSEMKCYTSTNSFLLLNGAVKNEIALYATKDGKELTSYTESQESITLSNGYTFNKNGRTVSYNGETLTIN